MTVQYWVSGKGQCILFKRVCNSERRVSCWGVAQQESPCLLSTDTKLVKD